MQVAGWARARPVPDPATVAASGGAAAARAARPTRRRQRRRSLGGVGAAAGGGEAAADAPQQQQQHQQQKQRRPPLPPAAQQQQQRLRLFYETSWPSAILHGSVRGGPWRDFDLRPVASGGGRLLVAELDLSASGGASAASAAAAASAAPLLEFVVTDPTRQHWDKPPGDEGAAGGGGNYVVRGGAGGGGGGGGATAAAFTLRSGALSPVPSTPPGVLLVSDLDGTMIGQRDDATARFRRWWEREAVPRGGVLCFSSGRSLVSICRLLDGEKRRVLARPDVVVGAVGTRVYWHERATPAAGGGRGGFPTTGGGGGAGGNGNGRSSGQGGVGGGGGSSRSSSGGGGGFVEDASWLEELASGGWDAPAAREAAYAALARAGKEAMHFLPPEDQSELKVSCGVRDDALAGVLEDLREGLARRANGGGCGGDALAGAQFVVSGHGGWRYVDVVPARAGKLAALEHVRRRGGFAPAQTVAAGDSGNDVAMLAGASNLAVVVGNAQPDAARWAEQRQAEERAALAAKAVAAAVGGGGGGGGADDEQEKKKDRLYRAKGSEAEGILEALEYWGLKEVGAVAEEEGYDDDAGWAAA